MDVETCVTDVVSGAGTEFDGEGEPTPLVGVYEVHNAEETATDGAEAEGGSPAGDAASPGSRAQAPADPYGDNPMKRKI